MNALDVARWQFGITTVYHTAARRTRPVRAGRAVGPRRRRPRPPPGRRIPVGGPSGAGKSTLAAVLLRFLDLGEGAATLNGADLAAYHSDDVRAVIGGCPQDPHIFDTTLRENLRLARPGSTDEEMDVAAARARLLPWIESLPRGWSTPVGVHGAGLSGGERQRLALARALLADPALLVLDEPTAHLDTPNRQALMSDLLQATRGRAVLFITHDLTGLDEFDEIVVLDQGRVAERGTHAQLITATLSGAPEQKGEDRFYARSLTPTGNTPENGAIQ